MANATSTTKTLADMAAEVDAYCQDKGWREEPVTFGEAMALLHSEVSEALEAWRNWGLRDATGTPYSDIENPQNKRLPKPEGVGSEFADVLIRWLDDCAFFGIDPDIITSERAMGWYALNKRFAENMDTLHVLIARASEAHAIDDPPGIHLAEVYRFLWQLSEHYGINLFAEYERKMQFNRSRPYKHGGRAI